MRQKFNIEEFLRTKVSQLDTSPTHDWDAFEKKLTRAVWASRAKSFASIALFFFALFAGYNGIQNNNESSQLNPNANYTIELSNFEQLSTTDFQDINNQTTDNRLNSNNKELNQLSVHTNPTRTKKSSAARKSTRPTKQNLGMGLVANTDFPENTQPTEENETSFTKEEATLSTTNTTATLNTISTAQVELVSADHILPSLPNKTINFLLFQEEPASNTEIEVNGEEENQRVPNLLAKLNINRGKELTYGTPISLMPPIARVTHSKEGHYISHLQEKNPWSYAINVYPNFTFREFKVDREKLNLLHRDFIDAIEASEKGGFSLNVGLGASRRVGSITYLNGGIEYITYNTEASFNFKNFRDANINTQTGEIRTYRLKDSPEQIVFSDRNSYHYINFPLSISYKPWASSHIRLNLEAGGSFMYFVAAKGKTIDYQTLEVTDLADRSYRKTLGSFSVKVGANYYVSESINFGFEPTLMYFTNTIYTQDIPFYVIPYSVGLNLHMQVKLN